MMTQSPRAIEPSPKPSCSIAQRAIKPSPKRSFVIAQRAVVEPSSKRLRDTTRPHCKSTTRSSSPTSFVHPFDIICNNSTSHPGNIGYHAIIASNSQGYSSCSTNREKNFIITNLRLLIQARSQFVTPVPFITPVRYTYLPIQKIHKKIRKDLQASIRKSVIIHSKPISLQSFTWTTFAQLFPEVEAQVYIILLQLTTNPSHHPRDPGPGLSLSCDSSYGNNPTISSQRKSYQRNAFANPTFTPNHDSAFQTLYAYGTGSGRATIGTPPR